jgi:SH3-like domain-containing protein
MTTHHRLPPVCAALALLTWGAAVGVSGAADRATPSGLPVPRYVSLKFDTVNARAGPGDDYKLTSVYHARGLPMQVVAETSEWRRVCDPEGAMVWIHKRTTDGRRTVINLQPRPVALLRKPKPAAPPVAYLNARAMAALSRCDDGYCKVKVAGDAGWVRQGELWGTLDDPQCR